MKTITSVFLFIALVYLPACQSQPKASGFTEEGFEQQVLDFSPHQRAEVSDKDFDFAVMIIEETKKAVKNDPDNFNLGDYWNILTAFYKLQEPAADLELAFQKMAAAEGSCEYILAFKDQTKVDDLLPELYQMHYDKCQATAPISEAFEPEEYAQQNQLDLQLIQQIYKIHLADQQYRDDYKKHESEQQALDQENQQQIEALFQQHQSYIGRSMVGEKLESVMWSVIQHSNLEMMERYLPVVHEAVIQQELDPIPLKMLIDRVYAQKFGYQIFGSQMGVDLAEKSIRDQVEQTYGLQ
jgi:hypothetical protein